MTDKDHADMTEHVHRYPPGFVPLLEEVMGPWQAGVEGMSAWRFCPACGATLKDSGYVGDEPQCSSCERPFMACPCGCVENDL